MPVYSEEEIISGCRKNNRAMQEYVYQQHYSLFLKVCARYAKNMNDAEQLLNDSFLKIFTNINKYNKSGSFQGWMKRILINTCLDFLRANYLKDQMNIHVNGIKINEENIPASTDGIEQVEFKELVGMIQSLPAMTRTVFNLFVFEGFDHKEISERLTISESTSHWHVHQARMTLQKKIKLTEQKLQTYETKRI